MTVDPDKVDGGDAADLPRKEPLPSEHPKPVEDEPDAPHRLRRILESRSYARADEDTLLLQRDELRPTRLSLEYLKVELALAEHAVASTIVLFGGTRILEPRAAAREVQRLEARVHANPADSLAQRALDKARRIADTSRYYDVARDFARLVSRECCQEPREFVVVTGGGPGIMEAGNRGAHDVGAPTVGLNITLPMEQFPNPYVTPELCFRFRYFALRKLHFMKRAKALVAFPGGYGTMDELFDALCLVQTRKITAMPIILVGRSFWQRAFDPVFLADEGVIADEDLSLISYAETADEIWSIVRTFYGL